MDLLEALVAIHEGNNVAALLALERNPLDPLLRRYTVYLLAPSAFQIASIQPAFALHYAPDLEVTVAVELLAVRVRAEEVVELVGAEPALDELMLKIGQDVADLEEGDAALGAPEIYGVLGEVQDVVAAGVVAAHGEELRGHRFLKTYIPDDL